MRIDPGAHQCGHRDVLAPNVIRQIRHHAGRAGNTDGVRAGIGFFRIALLVIRAARDPGREADDAAGPEAGRKSPGSEAAATR